MSKRLFKYIFAMLAFIIINEMVLHYGGALLFRDGMINTDNEQILSGVAEYAALFCVAMALSVFSAVIILDPLKWQVSLAAFSALELFVFWIGFGTTSLFGGFLGIIASWAMLKANRRPRR